VTIRLSGILRVGSGSGVRERESGVDDAVITGADLIPGEGTSVNED
jgi:hypothetical protein